MSMRTGLIAKKIGNTSYFSEDGTYTNVTILKVEECIVSNVKTTQKHGYNAVQLCSLETKKDIKKISKPQRKIFSAINVKPRKIIKEFRVDEDQLLDIGNVISVNHFAKDQFIDVTGISIGKGFAGAMKRHNFAGLRASHGVSISHRSHGSTGQNQDPGRVFKGKKMAGRMGAKRVTKQNLKIMDIDDKNKILIVKGSIPGKKNSLVTLRDAVKK